MKKRYLLLTCILLASALLSGCSGGNPGDGQDDVYSQLREKYFYDENMLFSYRQAWKLNLEDGSIMVACPDPLCGHGSNDMSCPFRSVIPMMLADGGRYLFYIGFKTSPISIFSFDSEENRTSVIYEYDKFPSSNYCLTYGDGRLYFDIPQLESSSGEYIEKTGRILMYYDVVTKEIKEFGKKDELDKILFAENGKIFYRGKDGKLYSTSGDFDYSEPVPLPEGGTVDAFRGYWGCGPGYVSKTMSPADIYLFNERRSLPLPPEAENAILVGLNKNADTFYFMLGSSAVTENEEGHYLEKICLLNTDGSYKIYTVISDFSFYVRKGYKNKVVCEILSEYIDGADVIPGTDSENTANSLIWIDLESGKASLYNTAADNASDIHLKDITVKVGVTE